LGSRQTVAEGRPHREGGALEGTLLGDIAGNGDPPLDVLPRLTKSLNGGYHKHQDISVAGMEQVDRRETERVLEIACSHPELSSRLLAVKITG
jgi:hypothetical protein